MDDPTLLRYARQILLPEVDIEGQTRLGEARVLIVGLGGLGSPVAMYLAAAGVGTLVLCDGDTVELSNLQRQIVHAESDLGRAKVDSAATRLTALNHTAKVITHAQAMQTETLTPLAAAADLVIDCTDSFASRLMVNAATRAAGRPMVFGAAIRFEGQVGVFRNDRAEAPCYACIHGEDVANIAQTCSTTGVIAPLLGVIGSLQALAALRCLLDVGEVDGGRLLLFDGLRERVEEMRFRRNPACRICGQPAGS